MAAGQSRGEPASHGADPIGKPETRSPILPVTCGKPHTGKGMKGTKPGTKGTKKGK